MRATVTSPSPSSTSLLACMALLAVARWSIAHAAEDEPAGYPPLPPPGLCTPIAQPPARIVETWNRLDAREQVESPTAASTSGEPPADSADSADSVDSADSADSDSRVLAEADRMALKRDGASLLEGDVWLQQGERFLSAEAMEYNDASGRVRTLSPARFGSRQMMLDAETAEYSTADGTGLFTDADFHLLQRGARGSADVLARTGDQTARLEGVMYTTCPPEDEDWWLKASSMDLDQESGIGTARNVRVAFMGVPFLYAPWISFPIDEQRKTGFLFPEFTDSSRTGASLRIPYYLNLAPNYDATLTPYYMSERGTMLDTEFRYLFRWGQGELDADYLDRDEQTGTARHYLALGHQSRLPADWQFAASYRRVSDEEYFQDFGQSGTASLVTHLSQGAKLWKTSLEYGASLAVQRYQTVDPTLPEARRPYEKWPDLNYYYTPLPFGDWLWMEVEGESVNFQRDDRISGWRHDVRTAFSADFGDPGLYVTPKLAWWQTEYDLEAADGTMFEHSRGLPVASLDMRARFSRPLASGGRQSLTPRLFHLYIPYRDQDGIPRFDTRGTSETIVTLFQENRFTGPDRVGDQHRLTFGLDTGFVSADGREWFNAAIARAWYLDDRRVALSADAEPQTATASDYYAALEFIPSDRHSLRLDAGWDPESREYRYGAGQYQFNPSDEAVVNLAYRYRRSAAEGGIPTRQADISFATPVGRRWSIFGRVVRDLEEERSQETLAGFEYENCCWVFRTFSRRFIFNREGEFENALWFQLELKGLSSVGRGVDEFLTDNIYGYGETP